MKEIRKGEKGGKESIRQRRRDEKQENESKGVQGNTETTKARPEFRLRKKKTNDKRRQEGEEGTC